MKEVTNFDDIREGELNERKKQKGMLESLAGFHRLTEDQQRYILASLYIQQRAERATDPVSAARIEVMSDKFKNVQGDENDPYINHSETSLQASHEEEKRYRKSQLKIMTDYCHQAVQKLESYKKTQKALDSWTEAGPINSYAELEELIALAEENSAPPFVIEIWSGSPKSDDLTNLDHTTVLLGKNKEGEYTMWEKSGWHMPFKLAPLKKMYDKYDTSVGWRIRPLSV